MNNWSNPWFDTWKNLGANPPWQASLDDWWRQFSKQSTSPYLQAFENIVDQSRLFFQMAERVSDPQTAMSMSNWQENLDQIFSSLKQSFDTQDSHPAAQLFWQMPLANWERTVSSLSALPGDGFPASLHGGFDPHAKLDQFLSTPGLGYAREYQAEYQKLFRLLLDYQKAYQKYSSFFVEVNKETLDCMRDSLLARAQGDEVPISSVRELYNLWVDCGEQVYARSVLTDDYSKMHGEIINALMALKHQGAQMMDDVAGSLNLPTRQEMDTIHQRFQASRRDAKAVQHELIATRQREAELAEQLSELTNKIEQLGSSAGGRSQKRKKSSKKKAANKKKKSAKSLKSSQIRPSA